MCVCVCVCVLSHSVIRKHSLQKNLEKTSMKEYNFSKFRD